MRNDLQCYARVLHLMAHFELGNFELMESLTKSVYRFMAKKENLTRVEEEMFRFLRRTFNISRHALKAEFEKFLEKLKQFERNRFETPRLCLPGHHFMGGEQGLSAADERDHQGKYKKGRKRVYGKAIGQAGKIFDSRIILASTYQQYLIRWRSPRATLLFSSTAVMRRRL